ncbi:MATE efflux family protein [Clostridia bacterium]|nr:MATE efflux family protein [Clostridia bacterium]
MIVPSAVESLLQMLAGDIVAQGIGNRVFQLFFALFRGCAVGVAVNTALCFGAGDFKECRRLAEQAYVTFLPAALLVTGMIFIFPALILRMFTGDPSILRAAAVYTKISIWGIPFMAATSVNTAAFQGRGDTRTPLAIAVFMNIVNICAGYIFIFGFRGIGGWGVTGAAAAGLISQAVGCGLGLYLLYRRNASFSGARRDERFFSLDKQRVRDIYAIGVPAALENVTWQFSSIILSRVILGYGSVHFAAYQLGLQTEIFFDLPCAGFVTASAVLSSRAIGMRNGNLLRAYYKSMVKMIMLISAFVAAALFGFPQVFMRILTDKPDIQMIGAGYVFFMGFAQPLQSFGRVCGGFIRSSGGKRVPMYIAFIGIWCVRIPLALLFGAVLHLDIRFVWSAIAVDHLTRAAINFIYMRRCRVTNVVERLYGGIPSEYGESQL